MLCSCLSSSSCGCSHHRCVHRLPARLGGSGLHFFGVPTVSGTWRPSVVATGLVGGGGSHRDGGHTTAEGQEGVVFLSPPILNQGQMLHFTLLLPRPGKRQGRCLLTSVSIVGTEELLFVVDANSGEVVFHGTVRSTACRSSSGW